ncbi:hypothetical protein METHB2_60013 [Candidatus Methylobacter favarea]|uniref:Uncharacterized protein n=1 Tax=Candidatus Methylobacter favarea TaxID=2707345 RepID=A0A8S0WRL3_9GAMM|nr:hypothetical protein [Candidatus Methylobacter favarea]CAA9892121.1 hypothetical protein METHB2_60013 [Candidatus Methylobacter favarea]
MIIVDPTSTIAIEPDGHGELQSNGDLLLTLSEHLHQAFAARTRADPVVLEKSYNLLIFFD